MPEQNQPINTLPIKIASEITATDYILGIGSAEEYQMLIQDLGDYIIQHVTSSLAGESQTLASAISGLNSKQTFNITSSTGTWPSEVTLHDNSYAQIIGNTVMLHLNLKIVSSTKKRLAITRVLPQNMRPHYDVFGIGGDGDIDGICQPFTIQSDGSISLWNTKTGTSYLQIEVTYLVNTAN